MSDSEPLPASETLVFASAMELAALITSREVSVVEVVSAHLDRIAATDDALGAFIEVASSSATAAALTADAALAAGEPVGPLHGVPVAIKDLDEVPGMRTTFGSVPLREHISRRSSHCVSRLVGAGAIVIGKTNTPEFGHKAVTDNAVRGPASTPFDLACNAGGSSGGSAAAVAAGQAPIAQGGDGGGSIRIPAALCGVYGLKPSYSRVAQVSRPNAFATHMPFVHVGPITRTVRDAALTLQVLSGYARADPMSVPLPETDFLGACSRPIEGMRVGFLPTFGGYPVEPEVAEQVTRGVHALEVEGAIVEDADAAMPLGHADVTALWLRQMGIGWAGVLAGFRAEGLDLLKTRREDLSPDLVEAVELAASLTVREVHEDLIERTRLMDWLESLLTGYDVLVSPTVGVSHIPNASDGRTLGPIEVNGVPTEATIGWTLTIPLNFSGHPGASVPVGLTQSGHPVGMQIVGARFADTDVLAASAAVERQLPWQQDYSRVKLSR